MQGLLNTQLIVDIQNMAGEMGIVFTIISMAFGLINVFFGYRIFKFILGLTGFAMGFAGGAFLAFLVFGGDRSISVILGAACGIAGAVLMVVFYKFGIFVAGAGLGSLLAVSISGIMKTDTNLTLVLVLALSCGGLALILQKLIIILATSIGGSWAIVSGFYEIANSRIDLIEVINNPGQREALGPALYIIVLFWALISALGILFQFGAIGSDDAVKQATQPAPEKKEE